MQKLIYRNPNGEEIDFTSGDFGVTKWSGFSKVDMDVQSQQVPFHDGSVFLDALLGERELSVTVAVNDDNNLEKRYRLKREMIHCLNPKLGEGELIYTNDYTNKKIVCVPDIPEFDNKNMNDSGTMKAMCSFTASNPYWEDVEETIVSFNADDYAEVENEGDVECSLQAKIYSNSVNKLALNNYTTNKKIQINGSFDSIFINTEMGKKTVTASINKFENVSNNYSVDHIVLGKNVFVMVGANTFYSTNGMDYFPIDIEGGLSDFSDVCYSSKLNCFIGYLFDSGENKIFKSLDGIHWNVLTTLNHGGSEAILFWSNKLEKFILANNANNDFYRAIYVSVDGETWEQKSAYTNKVRMFAESDSIICGVSLNSFSLITTDGESWTEQASDFSTNNIMWINKFSKFFAFTNNSLKTSTDGITWTEIYSSSMSNCKGITYDTMLERIILVADNKIKESYNGTTWSDIITYQGNSKATYIPDLNIFITVLYLYMNNFNFYKRITMPLIIDAIDMVYSDDKKILLAITNNGYSAIYDESKNWTVAEHPLSVGSYARITYGKNYFWLWGGGHVYKSFDGLNWIEVSSIVTGSANKFYYAKEIDAFIAIGNNGLLKVSFDDCLTWTDHSGVTNNKLNDITSYSNQNGNEGYIYIVGDNHTIVASDDGRYWSIVTFPGIENLSNLGGVTYSHSLQTLIISSGYKIVTHRENLWEIVNAPYYTYDYGKVKWSEELQCFLYVNSNQRNICALSFDCHNFYLLKYPQNGYPARIEYIDFLNSFFILQTSRSICAMRTNENNIIDSLTEDSDMNLNLSIGKNLLKITRDSGYANMVLSYKQKYLGV